MNERVEHDLENCPCECHFLATLSGGGVHNRCERCSGPLPPIEHSGHPADDN